MCFLREALSLNILAHESKWHLKVLTAAPPPTLRPGYDGRLIREGVTATVGYFTSPGAVLAPPVAGLWAGLRLEPVFNYRVFLGCFGYGVALLYTGLVSEALTLLAMEVELARPKKFVAL